MYGTFGCSAGSKYSSWMHTAAGDRQGEEGNRPVLGPELAICPVCCCCCCCELLLLVTKAIRACWLSEWACGSRHRALC